MNADTTPRGERGGVLLATVLFMLFLGGLTGTLLAVQLHRDRLKNQYSNKINSLYSAEGGINYGVELIWTGYLGVGGGKPGKLADFRAYLNRNSFLSIPEKTWVSVPLGTLKLGPGVSDAVEVYRTDSETYTDLRFRSSATVNGHTETVESTFRTEGHTFSGFNFALFSNNISCTFCHAKIDSVQRASGKPYERVRVATLESLMIRSDSANSTIAGALYTTGKIMDMSGTVLSGLASSSLDGYSLKNNLVDPKTSKRVDLQVAPVGSDGNPAPGYNLYKDYPKDPARQTDGAMPGGFPPVFPDENENRVVDNDEFDRMAGTAAGKASGLGFVVPQGSSFGGNLATSNPVSVSGSVEGNLILTGTTQNPIRLDGKIVVNGDVIIQGVVQGMGSIFARGNVYVTGDLTYQDAVVNGVRQFGVAADGTQNGLGLASGGNIMVGDYLTPRGGSVTNAKEVMNGLPAAGWGFTFSQLTLFNRREWQKTQRFLPGAKGKLVANSTYVPGYTPRYYVLAEGNPVYVYYQSLAWDDATQTWLGKEHAHDFSEVSTITPGAGSVISVLNPTNPWVTPDQLKQFWMSDESKRRSGAALQVDALLYTDRSIFTLARPGSKLGGNMVVNGALVAADTGILAPGGLSLNYDKRVTDFLDIKDSTDVTFRRVLEVRRNPVIARN